MKKNIKAIAGRVIDHLLAVENMFRDNKSLLIGHQESYIDERIAILAIYRLERLDEVRRYVQELKACRFTVIPIINVSKLSKVPLELNQEFFLRENRGFDLGIYRDGCRLIQNDRNQRTQIIFLNDSMFYEAGTLSRVIKLVRSLPENVVYSILESCQGSRHVQTYFLFGILEPTALKQLKFVLNQVNNWRFKRSAVALGEKRLSLNLMKSEVLARGLWSTQELKDLVGNCRTCDEIDNVPNNQINPTTHLIHKLEGTGIVCHKF